MMRSDPSDAQWGSSRLLGYYYKIKFSDTTIASQIRAPCECEVVRSSYRSESLQDALGQNWAHDGENAEQLNESA